MRTQGRVKQIARIVAGKWPSRPIRAMKTGSESDNQEPPVQVAEARDTIVEIRRELFPVGAAEFRKPGAQRTIARRLAIFRRPNLRWAQDEKPLW
jgi:hypothetical protein